MIIAWFWLQGYKINWSILCLLAPPFKVDECKKFTRHARYLNMFDGTTSMTVDMSRINEYL